MCDRHRFLLVLIFMGTLITNVAVTVKHSKTPSVVKIDLSEKTDKKLVPFGYANHDDETNEIELKYRIYVEGGIRKSIMHTNLLSVTVDDGTDFSHLFLVIFPKEQEINKLH